MTSRRDLEEALLEMKDGSEFMVDLAWSSVFYNSEDIAEEVQELEDQQDRAYADLQRALLTAVRDGTIDPEAGLALGGLAMATEMVADAARDIADVVLREVEPHPVLQASMAESDVVTARLIVVEGSEMAGRSLGDEKVQTNTGMVVFAIRRGASWIHGPDKDVVLNAGDVILARGPAEGVEKLEELVVA